MLTKFNVYYTHICSHGNIEYVYTIVLIVQHLSIYNRPPVSAYVNNVGSLRTSRMLLFYTGFNCFTL